MTHSDSLEDLYIFTGSANPDLSTEVCGELGVPLLGSETRKFGNDNLWVQLHESVRGKHVSLIQPLGPPNVSDCLMELLMMVDIARTGAAGSVQAVIPYFSYARSDKKDRPRISITARLVADMLTTAGADRVITMTLHSPQVHGFFGIPADHLTAVSLQARYFKQQDLSNTAIVSPDVGFAKRAAHLAEALGVTLMVVDKVRISDTEVRVRGILGTSTESIERVIIVDDEIASGGTIAEVIQALHGMGIHRFSITCTHGVFTLGAVERLLAIEGVEEIVTTNTLPQDPQHMALENFHVLSVAPIFAGAIRCNHLGISVGELFEFWL